MGKDRMKVDSKSQTRRIKNFKIVKGRIRIRKREMDWMMGSKWVG